ncbi:M23 family metallopeptidase [Pusillimonas sp. MFBS29]|uniref:M23 family metallopeptidase n=1 Tax=Pusillimonas sp. MFBS29 TaxID=2886690 RepID=UPI001D0FCD4A|nr:M23 family metallopeptidase [Pusillimonas sp. MFBS29]MCC2597439.1 M23 family metallopeptidase [Pusillimonas sp. MFBS29]
MRNRSADSTAKGFKGLAIGLLVACAMGASAVAGAWVQSQRTVQPVLSSDQERIITEQALRDSAYVRQNVNLLAGKVGDLQAKLIAMDGLSKRVAEVAGVSYTDPEVQASIEQTSLDPVMDDITTAHGASWSAEGLGRELDILTHQLSEQKDWFAMLDLVMTKRTGVEASLPTLMPVDYPYLSSSFGWRRNPVTGRHTLHEGLDFAAPKGTPIRAASGGVVTQARYATGYGKLVEINHGNGLITRYAHASSINVKVGDLVEKGQLIARVGSTGRSTGSHLHFEVRMAGHPLDPTLFLADQQAPEHLVTDASKVAQAVTAKVR